MPKISPLPLIGVDTGGTFTDLVLVDGSSVRAWKLPSTPADPARAVLDGVRHLVGARPALIFHGSTVATNALLEGKGAPVALLVTAGFRDLLLIGRQNRPDLYALQPVRPAPLVPRRRCFEVEERLHPDGTVEVPLRAEEIARLVAAVRESGVASAAICLLHSYANPDHENRLAAALQAAGCAVSLSSRILPEFREFERAATTAVNAAVSPVMDGYLQRLRCQLAPSRLRVMQSNGGAIGAEAAGQEAVRTILSGPAGGIVGAFHIARAAGFSQLLTFDMGGTSTDVALCPGEIPSTSETVIGGWPVKVPMLAIHTVGAGGGSVARLDAGGALRVGPESAGADPGPACYGRGGPATVTDAHLYLGRLLPDRFLGGRMRLEPAAASRVVEELARQAGLAPRRLAEGILEVAEAAMADALRVVSVARGHDPRQFTLLPFGGAGGLHACALAERLAIPRILVPAHPGLLSAVGLVRADTLRDYSRSVLRPGRTGRRELQELFRPLEVQARADMAGEGIRGKALELQRSLDLRYRGQSFEVGVPFAGDFLSAFHLCHERLYGYRDPAREVEIVTLRLRARAPGPAVELAPEPVGGELRPISLQEVVIDGRPRPLPLYERAHLPFGAAFAGPALVVEESATHLIRPGWQAQVDARGNLLLTRLLQEGR